MNLPPLFNAQFFNDDGTPLDGGLLYTYVSGTTTPQLTYVDQAGETENTNPIELDAAGRCDLWLDPELEYTLLLRTAEGVLVKTWDDVAGAMVGEGAVTSINDLTGAVELTADDVPFETGTATSWFGSQTDATAAIDTLITRVDAQPASSVTVLDAGALLTATNVEAALAELATDIAALSPLPAFTAAIAGGNISTSVASGVQSYGSRTCTPTGGTAPYTYSWVVQNYTLKGGTIYPFTIPTTAAMTFAGDATGTTVTALATCFVTDATGRVTTATVAISATHA